MSLDYSMSIKLLTEQHLEFLSLKGGCTGSSESTLVKIPYRGKSHVTAQIFEVLRSINFAYLDLCGHIQTKQMILYWVTGPKILDTIRTDRFLLNIFFSEINIILCILKGSSSFKMHKFNYFFPQNFKRI